MGTGRSPLSKNENENENEHEKENKKQATSRARMTQLTFKAYGAVPYGVGGAGRAAYGDH